MAMELRCGGTARWPLSPAPMRWFSDLPEEDCQETAWRETAAARHGTDACAIIWRGGAGCDVAVVEESWLVCGSIEVLGGLAEGEVTRVLLQRSVPKLGRDHKTVTVDRLPKAKVSFLYDDVLVACIEGAFFPASEAPAALGERRRMGRLVRGRIAWRGDVGLSPMMQCSPAPKPERKALLAPAPTAASTPLPNP